jgi:hypothetical protein
MSPFSPIFLNLLMILATEIRLSTENINASTRHWAVGLIAIKPIPSVFPIFRAFPQVFPEYATYFQEIRQRSAIYRQCSNSANFSMIGTFGVIKARFFPVSLRVCLQAITGTAIRALGLTGLRNRQVHLWMRIPQVHAGHRAGQGQVLAANLVAVLCVGRNEVFVDVA